MCLVTIKMAKDNNRNASIYQGCKQELRKQVLKSHPELAHQVSALRKRLLQTLQERAALAGAQRAFAVFLGERQRVVL